MVKKCKCTYSNSNKDSKKDYKPKQNEINAMVIEAVKAIKIKKTKDKEKVQQELNAFEGITLSDSDESEDSGDS